MPPPIDRCSSKDSGDQNPDRAITDAKPPEPAFVNDWDLDPPVPSPVKYERGHAGLAFLKPSPSGSKHAPTQALSDAERLLKERFLNMAASPECQPSAPIHNMNRFIRMQGFPSFKAKLRPTSSGIGASFRSTRNNGASRPGRG